MSVVAAAVIGSTIVGGITSDRASDKSADAANKGIAATNELAKQARTDAINLFSQSRNSTQNGIGSALNFYQQNAQARANPFIQGNVAAQQVLGAGATQANNAILGLPVDMSFANQPKQMAADYSGITAAQLPQLGASFGDTQPPLTLGGKTDSAGMIGRLMQNAANKNVNVSSVPQLGMAPGNYGRRLF